MKQRAVSLLLAGVMAGSLLAGCGEPSNTEKENQSQQVDTQEEAKDSASEESKDS